MALRPIMALHPIMVLHLIMALDTIMALHPQHLGHTHLGPEIGGHGHPRTRTSKKS